MPLAKDILNSTLDLFVPHARKDPLNPMEYVRDFNEWFLPAGQMALDEYEGKESYPSSSYILASLPVVGKVSKHLSKALKPLSKEQKLKAITKANKMADDYHTGIRTIDDIYDLNEVLDDFGNPDITREMLENAIKNDKIKVYSSKPFSQGSFITPSKMMAQDYAGRNGKIYEIEISPNDIGWISGDEGQIARMPR